MRQSPCFVNDSEIKEHEINGMNHCKKMTDKPVATKTVKCIKPHQVDSYKKDEVDSLESGQNEPCNRACSDNKGSLTLHVCTYEDCDKVFSRPSRLTQHLRTHTGERPYVCPSAGCSRSYTRQQHLKRHIETGHQDKSEEKLKCDRCEKFFTNVYCLKKHQYRYHVRNLYKCDTCEQTFKKQQHLRTHSFVHTGVKPYSCDFPGCDVQCETPSRLKRHNMVHEKNRYACPQESCQLTFDTYKELQQHLSSSHPKVCDICSKTFQQLRRLKVHRLTHDKNVQVAFFCPYVACDKYFYHENNLNAHIATKHDQTRIYQCGVCDKRLSTKQKLMHHTKTHSPSYKRNFKSEKPRKPRKDKGVLRRDFARLLSNYYSDEESTEMIDLENSQDNTQVESQCHDTLDVRKTLEDVNTKQVLKPV